MKKDIQAKDVPERPILQFLAGQTLWSTWTESEGMPTVLDAVPEGTPTRVVLAKMRSLVRRGLVDGCACGCRGDFRITDKGREGLDA